MTDLGLRMKEAISSIEERVGRGDMHIQTLYYSHFKDVIKSSGLLAETWVLD